MSKATIFEQNGVNAETKESDSVKKATGTIAKITDAVVEGNTHQYILLENDSEEEMSFYRSLAE